MKAISIKQPWATFVAEGAKTIETRKWKTSYRGPLLIVSSTKVDYHMSSFTASIAADVFDNPDRVFLPIGTALAICNLVDCRPMTEADEIAAMCEIYPRAQAWVFEEIKKIGYFGVKGKPGLYEVDFPPCT